MFSNIERFVRLVTAEFSKIDTTITGDNCTWAQHKALKELKAMRDVIIKSSDKGGNVVIWPIKNYGREVYRQLREMHNVIVD